MRLVALLLIALATMPAAVAAKEFVAKPEDFRCITEGVRAPGKQFFIFHRRKSVRAKALRKTVTGKLGKKGYPIGTILQVFPFEAMVKRGGRFNREGGGWEWFRLTPKADGTTEIVARGGAEVANVAGSCQSCHVRVAADHDSVCEFVIGAAGLGLTDDVVAAAQAGDPRCR